MRCVANRISADFYNQRMLLRSLFSRPLPTPALARWALAAWLGVLLASGIAPWASAAAPVRERLCSASGDTQWTPAPAGDVQPASHGHFIDCALCLPWLAPPPVAEVSLARRAVELPQPARPRTAQQVLAFILPPVRAPPVETI